MSTILWWHWWVRRQSLRLHVQLAVQSPAAATNNLVWCCWCQPFILLGLINEYYTVMTLTSQTSEFEASRSVSSAVTSSSNQQPGVMLLVSAFHPFWVDKWVLYCDDIDESDVRVEASHSVSNAATSSSNQQPGVMLFMSSLHHFEVDKWVVCCNWMFAFTVSSGNVWWTLTR